MQSWTEVKAESPSASGEPQRGRTAAILSREGSAVGMGCWWVLKMDSGCYGLNLERPPPRLMFECFLMALNWREWNI